MILVNVTAVGSKFLVVYPFALHLFVLYQFLWKQLTKIYVSIFNLNKLCYEYLIMTQRSLIVPLNIKLAFDMLSVFDLL